jgi:hypothetical protein
MMVERWFTEEYLKMHRDAWDRRLQKCKVQHTIKATAASSDTNKHVYVNSFIYCDTQVCFISNHRAVFLAVGVT